MPGIILIVIATKKKITIETNDNDNDGDGQPLNDDDDDFRTVQSPKRKFLWSIQIQAIHSDYR